MRTWLFLLTCGVVVLAVYIATLPVPEGFSNPWLLRIVNFMSKLNGVVLTAGHKYGFWDKWKIMQSFTNSSNAPEEMFGYVQVEDRVFNGVKVRVYRPKGAKTRPGIIFYHGGGFAVGTPQGYDKSSILLAVEVDAVLVSVDYRLAPEYTFPTQIEDCEVATRYFLENTAKYNVDGKRVALMGDSAGGNIAAVMSQTFNRKFPIKLQVLLYPLLQSLDTRTPSYQFGGDAILQPYFSGEMVLSYALGTNWDEKDLQDYLINNHTSPEIKKKLYSTYLSHSHIPKDLYPAWYTENKDDYGNLELWKRLEPIFLEPRFSPLLAVDLHGLPEAYILTCQPDILRDDGYFYAKRLGYASVKVTHVNLPNCVHGIISFDFMETGIKVLGSVIEFTRKTL